MNRLLSALLLTALLMGCTAPQPLRPEQLPALPLAFALPQIDHIVLPNGMSVYLKEDHELPLVSITVMAAAGSIGDPAAKTGLAELVARSLRTGGAGKLTPDQVDEQLERLAADFSVTADPYSVSLDLSLLAEDLEPGLDLLAATLRRPTFDAERIEQGRRQMIEGIRRQNDHPAAIAGRALLRSIYGDHPLGRQPTEATVTALRRDDLLAFQRATFQPQNLWVAISGDFDSVKLLAELERLFGDWPRGTAISQTIPPVTAAPHPVVVVTAKALPQTVVQIGELGIDKSAPDLAATRVMNFILGGGGFNSRLMREIRAERGLAYSVYSYYQVGRRLPGPFIAQCETKNATALEVVGLIKQEMERMRTAPVTAEELRVAKESLINSFVFSFTNPHEIVTQALRIDFYGYPPDYLESFRSKIDAVTIADVTAAAQAHLHPEQMTVVLVGDTSALGAAVETLGLPVEHFEP